MIVAIDGPAGAGKSTVAKLIATKLKYVYLDTGALYRAVAWKALATGTDTTSPDAMKRLCESTQLTIRHVEDGGMIVEVDGRRLTSEIRTPEVTRAASQVAAIAEVRSWLLPIQQGFGRRKDVAGIVAEGRDLGTRVFPEATVKFFFQADLEERARRRHQELMTAGKVNASDLSETSRALDARDGQDQSRDISPLRPAEDAEVIDTTSLTAEEVVERMLSTIERKAAALQ
jgi:cytidylate kinase